jgi:hypothetical protein
MGRPKKSLGRPELPFIIQGLKIFVCMQLHLSILTTILNIGLFKNPCYLLIDRSPFQVTTTWVTDKHVICPYYHNELFQILFLSASSLVISQHFYRVVFSFAAASHCQLWESCHTICGFRQLKMFIRLPERR